MTLPSAPVKWHTTFADSSPIWTSEPAISDIVSVASQALSPYLQNQDPSSISVTFFAEGTFNKLYEITILNHKHRFLLRVTLPVDPFLKTESEVATLAFLRQKTSIPIPEVVAWCSTSRNTIGYEWILVKKVEGVPIEQKWRAMPLDAKIRLSEKLAAYAIELRALAFDKIGSLYFKNTDENSSTQNSQQIKFMSDYLGKDVEVGKMVSSFFFVKRRLYIPSDRGPFSTSHQYLTAKINLQTAWIKSGVEIAESENASDIDSDCDEELVEDAPEMLDVCQRALKLVSDFFPVTVSQNPGHSLFHHYLNFNNVIIDPEAHEIVAIIDWEMACVLPRWDAYYYPKLFAGIDPITEEEPPIPVDYNDEDDYTIVLRDRWDARILRRAFDSYIRGVSDSTDARAGIFVAEDSDESEDFEMERELDDAIWNLTDNWEGARSQMRKLQAHHSS